MLRNSFVYSVAKIHLIKHYYSHRCARHGMD